MPMRMINLIDNPVDLVVNEGHANLDNLICLTNYDMIFYEHFVYVFILTAWCIIFILSVFILVVIM